MKYYVALDIGNVLCKVDFKKFTFAIAKATNLTSREVNHRIHRVQKFQDVGLADMKHVLEAEFLIKNPATDELLEIWNKEVLKFDNNMFDFFTDLTLDSRLSIALLSNVGPDHALVIDAYIDKMYSSEYSSDIFKNAIRYYSCNVGVRKPQSLYYQSFLQMHPEFTGCVYLDDLKENLKASLQFGFKAVEFDLEKLQDVKAPLEAIKKMILEPKNDKNSRWIDI